MSRRGQFIGVAAVCVHLFLVVLISLQDLPSRSDGRDNAPEDSGPWLNRIEMFASMIRGQHLAVSNPVRQAVIAYSDWTGIETGYSYFAPSVPANSKLAFELQYPDGRVEYELPMVVEAAAGDRVSALLDRLHYVHYVRLREALLRSLVNSVHQEHPDAIKIRAVFGAAELTTPAEYKAGKGISYHPLFAYDFRYNTGTQLAER